MRAWYVPCYALLVAAGCGRFGVQALLLDAGMQDPHNSPDPNTTAAEGGTPDAHVQAYGGATGSGFGPDAAIPTQVKDAGIENMRDSGAEAGAGTLGTCLGQPLFGMCWYLAAGDKSCNEACANKGGFDTRAFTYIGTPSQGGSLSECKQILTALGHAGTVVEATQTSGLGIGCHVWTDGRLYWLSDPAFDPAAKANTPDHNSHIACACMN